ncbi:hypothetical protein C5167_030226 [Papaver somniferum]|nr:hypothetical protein C5167_030226 [Papaver somniferum]
MGETWRNLIGGLFLVLMLPGCVSGDIGVNIWPMPKSVKHGGVTLQLSKDFGLKTSGWFSRLCDLVEAAHAIDASKNNVGLLKGLHIVILSPDDTLQYGIDESYDLFKLTSLREPGHGKQSVPVAQTVYGALHGLQTFSQLCQFNFGTKTIEVHHTPWSIADEQRFSFRGLLIDTSRHYLPLPSIKKVIDAMAYTKLNVLHWHIVDTQSFPLEIPSYPKLWNGAYSDAERYTMADAAVIVDYARRRGINILAEIDIPGHALSWGVGYPQLWPSPSCQQPLEVSNEFTFKISARFSISNLFISEVMKLMGDYASYKRLVTIPKTSPVTLDLDYYCFNWTLGQRTQLNEHQMNASEAYQYFVLRAQKIALSHGYEIVNWEETFRYFGSKLSPKTVVHNWLDRVGGGLVQQAVAEGLRCIVKRTWTPFDKLARDPRKVAGRVSRLRCLLNQRGVAAAPLAGLGRDPPTGPGSCFKQ